MCFSPTWKLVAVYSFCARRNSSISPRVLYSALWRYGLPDDACAYNSKEKHGRLSVLKCDGLLFKTLHYSYATLFKRTGWINSLINVYSYFRDISLVLSDGYSGCLSLGMQEGYVLKICTIGISQWQLDVTETNQKIKS